MIRRYKVMVVPALLLRGMSRDFLRRRRRRRRSKATEMKLLTGPRDKHGKIRHEMKIYDSSYQHIFSCIGARIHRTDGEIQVAEDRPLVPPTGRRDTDGQRIRRKGRRNKSKS